MLVYGQANRNEEPRDKIARVRTACALAAAASGIERHGYLVGALIEAGELVQGLADHAFHEHDETDERCPEADVAMKVTVALARLVLLSWSSRFGPIPDPREALEGALEELAAMALPAMIEVSEPEGFAFYCLYPECYLASARDLPRGDGPVRVIGLRSIGTTLAALVAVALEETALPHTLRPIGHPFQRRVQLGSAYASDLVAAPAARFAIVDEGPGLSGSSFASVACFLSERGIGLDRMHFLPSHLGKPGPRAAPETLRVWDEAQKHVRTFDEVVLEAAEPAHRLTAWVADLVGPATAPLIDISGGEWRRAKGWREADWPPVHAWQERRKFLLRTQSGLWVLKFAGLGRKGTGKFDRARRLAEAGFTPKPVGWRHGFLIEPWLEGAKSVVPSADREARIEQVGAYLGFRAKPFLSTAEQGASTATLFEMTRHNIEESLGRPPASRVNNWRPWLDLLESRRRPVETDNRLHNWEWLDLNGRLIKTDALDHHAGHDLIGAQDIAWDVVGAAVEFGLTGGEQERLAGSVEHEGGVRVDADLLAFYRPCYLAFQLGYYQLAIADAACAQEAAQLEATRQRYAALLAEELGAPG